MTSFSMHQTEIPECQSLLKGHIELTLVGSGKTISQPSHSFVTNIAHAFRASCMYELLSGVVKNTGGTSISVLARICKDVIYNANHYVSHGVAGLEVNANAGDSTNGIIVGNGTGTGFNFDPANYCLKRKIAHLSGTGDPDNKLAYGSSTVISSMFTDNAWTARATRDFTNTSTTGSITITEVGLVGATAGGNCLTVERVLLSRDVLDPEITIPSGKTLLVSYVLTGEL